MYTTLGLKMMLASAPAVVCIGIKSDDAKAKDSQVAGLKNVTEHESASGPGSVAAKMAMFSQKKVDDKKDDAQESSSAPPSSAAARVGAKKNWDNVRKEVVPAKEVSVADVVISVIKPGNTEEKINLYQKMMASLKDSKSYEDIKAWMKKLDRNLEHKMHEFSKEEREELNKTRETLETHLSDEEFAEVFEFLKEKPYNLKVVTKRNYARLPAFKKKDAKKKAGLF